MATRKKSTAVAVLPPRAKAPVVEAEPRGPVTVRFTTGIRSRFGDYLRYLLGWELRMDLHILFPHADLNEPAQLSHVRIVSFPPEWWERVSRSWQTTK